MNPVSASGWKWIFFILNMAFADRTIVQCINLETTNTDKFSYMIIPPSKEIKARNFWDISLKRMYSTTDWSSQRKYETYKKIWIIVLQWADRKSFEPHKLFLDNEMQLNITEFTFTIKTSVIFQMHSFIPLKTCF